MSWVTVKIQSATHRKTKRLVEAISKIGWAALQSDRQDPPNLGTVIDEAIEQFEKKAKDAGLDAR
jgi:hypothetical protein